MSKTPDRASARPHGRRRAVAPNRSALARAAKKGTDRFGNRSAVVALSLGLLAVAGGGAAATANSADLARTASVTAPSASAAAQTPSPSQPSALAQASSDARAAADKAAADKAAADKAAAAKAAADKAAADKSAADKAAADKAAADKAAADQAAAAAAKAAAAAQPVNDPAAAQAYAASRLSAFGWGQDQMSALVTLWNKESGWSTTATNASSGAYGIVQSLPGSKMASVGADWQTNYKTQIDWGLDYIKKSYGSPANALAFHLAHNWY
ncbi:aggregation-promoting factor C-terminal-like domain-containing protein [Sinomonas soli]